MTPKDYNSRLIRFLTWAMDGAETVSDHADVNELVDLDIESLIEDGIVYHRVRHLGRHIHGFMTTDKGFKYLQSLLVMEKI